MHWRGISRHSASAPLPRHRHTEPYLAIVLTGGFVEAGDAGRVRARPGDVLIHYLFDAHRDTFERAGATVLNLPLRGFVAAGVGQVDDVDQIVRLAERDPWAASERAQAELRRGGTILDDWPDLLATALAATTCFSLSDWARRHGLAPASLSRGFAQTYGVSPQRYRAEQRARRAVIELMTTTETLTGLAAKLGFADQAHMSRAVAAMTGHPPRKWHAKCVQENIPDPG